MSTQLAPVSYLEAIRRGLWEEMERDPAVFCLGEDIAVFGGAFKLTAGFLERFGIERIIDTPIAESAIVGSAFGAAIAGMRPVAEIQFMDFIGCAFNQITNMLAKSHYRWGAPAPIVLRGPSGGGVHGGPFHSQNPEMHFVHTPGLKIVCPGTPTDAYGLIKSAIRDNNPVIFFEHKLLYRTIKEQIPVDVDFTVPIGRARLAREGKDISVITYAAMLHVALEAAEVLKHEDIELDVLDLRTLLPLDRDAIARTVKKTRKVIVLHEDTMTGGIAGEISAIINEDSFYELALPLERITSLDTPVPFSPPLERAFLPSMQMVIERARCLKQRSASHRIVRSEGTQGVGYELKNRREFARETDRAEDFARPESSGFNPRAQSAIQSNREVPNVYMLERIKVDRLCVTRPTNTTKAPHDDDFTRHSMPYIVRAVCDAICDFPILNSSIENNAIRYHSHIHLVVESLDNSFIALRISEAEFKSELDIESLLEKQFESISLEDSARWAPELATFTLLLSTQTTAINLPLVRPPQVAILSIGKARKMVTAIEGGFIDRIGIRTIVPFVLSHDHRVIDGNIASQFLQEIKRRIEAPDLSYSANREIGLTLT